MKLLKLNIKRIKKKLERNKRKIARRLTKSYIDVKDAIIHHLYNDEVLGYGSLLHAVSPITGECYDYLMYFPDYDIISKIKNYLEAYLITNRDVLEEDEIGELEGLIRYFG
jgi:hypothetical protein